MRLDAQWAEGGVHWQQVSDDTQAPVDVAPYQQQLQSLEEGGGPYTDGLAEPLASLGRHYRSQGDYEQAVALYRRAMHVVRINDGLNSDRQIPLLRELLVSYREAGDLQSLDERYSYFFHLYGNGQPPYSQLRIGAALEYMRWQREAIRREMGGDQRRLIKLIELNEDILESMQLEVDIPYSWRRDLTYSQVLNFYLLTQRFVPAQAEGQLLTSRDYMGSKPAALSLEEQKLEARLRSATAQVARVLDELLAAASLQGPVEVATIHLALADWYHWNGSRQRAAGAYEMVVSTLRDAGEDALLQEWLGEPVELPDNGVFWQPELRADARPVTVAASFDVSARGKLSQLQTRLLQEEERSLNRFRRQLASTLFRPRWVNGEAEAVSGLRREYQLLE